METVKWIQLIFLAWRFPSTYPSLCYKGNSGNSKNKNKNRPTSLRNFVPNFGLRNFRHGNSTVLPTNFVDGRAYILIAQKIAHTHTNENKSKRHDSWNDDIQTARPTCRVGEKTALPTHDRLRFDRIMAMSLVCSFSAHPLHLKSQTAEATHILQSYWISMLNCRLKLKREGTRAWNAIAICNILLFPGLHI